MVLVSSAHARDEDPIKERLDKAKSTYDSKTKSLRDDLLKRLTAQEEQSAKSSNKKLADRAAAERDLYDKEGLLAGLFGSRSWVV
ncbi:MAG: hypothetical protein K2V38_27975 [Gemmataceae bacterium]|nr:hypothetical protein [Gemmataceae bacterium]